MLEDKKTFETLVELLETKGYVDVEASGLSMYPYIKEGDVCRFLPLNKTSLVKGEVVLYRNNNGNLIGHRFLGMKREKKGQVCLVKGDADLTEEIVVRKDQVIGKLVLIQRKERVLEPDDFSLTLWTALVLYGPGFSRVLNKWVTKLQRKQGVVPFPKKR